MSQSSKMKTFPLNSKNKKDIEKQKKMADEEAAAEVFEEFVATFEASKPQPKLFVRGNVINPSSGQELSAQQSGRYYKPEKLKELERKKNHETKVDKPKTPTFSNEKPPKKKGDVKKKSNLEMFKEELKMIQEEREERSRLRNQYRDKPSLSTSVIEEDENRKLGSHDNGDPNTTNIYLGSLNPKLTESQLCEIFGRYGPLASIKIMWPRTDEERTRNRNCGFVAFMCRKDGERAMKAMNGRMVMDFEMRLGWGKAVPIPAHPIYIPKNLLELTMPPPPSGLPFNAQVIEEKDKQLLEKYGNDPQMLFREDKDAFDDLLSRCVVKVVIPTDRNLISIIHRVVEFVVREGPLFEALLMSREAKNPLYSFLFDNQSPPHIYYRWRLFSVLQGEHPSRWRTKEFVMFKGGSKWKPPLFNMYLRGMPEELLPKEEEYKLKSELTPSDRIDDDFDEVKSSRSDAKKGQLSETSREQLEDMLRLLTPERQKIADLMIFCIQHADACEEIIECIADSLCISETPLHKKIARLYLLSDILHNCSVKVANVSNYRKQFQSKLDSIFESINQAYNQIEGRLKAEHFKQRVMCCFRAWEDSAIYSSDVIIKLQNIFLGIIPVKRKPIVQAEQHKTSSSVDDIDGVPIDPEIDGEELDFNSSSFSNKFKPSKWETVDPDVVVSQAITSRWENLEKSTSIFPDDDIDGKPLDDTDYFDSLINIHKNKQTEQSTALSRKVLREIELKVIKYQDELESDQRSGRLNLGPNSTISQLVEKYRADLLRVASSTDSSNSPKKLHHSKRRSKSRSRSPPVKRRK